MRSRGLLVVAVLVVIGVVGVVMLRGAAPLLSPDRCTARVGSQVVELSPEQAENATLIAAVGVRRGLPPRAVSIALATAYQESKIVNLSGGDRDSIGLFQQRPSQGWGTPGQIRDPYYATNAFYDALAKVPDYSSLRITEAAQRVQRSGFPEAYADHASDARALASALTGYSPGGRFSCRVRDDPSAGRTALGPGGLTPRAGAVRRDLVRAFGPLPLGGFAPGGVSTGHAPDSAHYDGRALDVFVRPVSTASNRRGWAVAAYLVAHAARLEVSTVIFDGRIWTVRRSAQGWRDYTPPASTGSRVVLEHRDHVHVDVAP